MPTKTFLEIAKTQFPVQNKTLDETNSVLRKINSVDAVARSIAESAGDIPSIKDFGAVSGQDASVALQKAIDWLPAEGGMIIAPPGAYQFSTKIVPTKPIIIIGCGDTTTRFIKKTSSYANLNHWLESDYSVGLYNLGIETESALDQNYQMSAVRLDLDGASAGFTKRRLHIQSCRVDGFNVGVYGDGGAHYGLEFQTLNDTFIKNGGPLSGYIGSCLYGNRVENLRYHQLTIDQNFTGEHGVYCFGVKQASMDSLYVKNATRTEAQAVKLVGDFAGPSTPFRQWSLYNITAENCFHGILLSVYNSETIHQISVRDVAFEGITGSDNILGQLAFYLTGTAKIDQINVDGARFNDASRQCVHFSGSASNRIENINLANIVAKGWSGVSAGTHALVGTSGSMTAGQLNFRMVRANGQIGGVNHGRAVINPDNLAGIERVNLEDVEEVNTTFPGVPVNHTDDSSTPSVHIGTKHYINNQNPTNLTGLANMRRDTLYVLYFANANTTMVNGATMVMKGGSNVLSQSGMVRSFYTHDGVVAYEIG